MVNGAWIAAAACERKRFNRAVRKVEPTQRDYLLRLLRTNAATRFGRQYGFAGITSVAEYQKRVPVCAYESLRPYIDAIARGEPSVLTADPVRLFQPTSGTLTGTKFIPWTAALAREFRRGINPWIAALYQRNPALLRGTAYWSISPPATADWFWGSLRVGFDHDAEYLGVIGRKLFSLVNSVPSEVARSRDLAEFKTRTLLALLADENLSLISVWSPTFLTMLVEDFWARRDELVAKLGQGSGAATRRRAETLRALMREAPYPGIFERIWPKLAVISCWTHGASELYAQNLRRHFPTVEIQGKGLIATEAMVSFPLCEDVDPVLAVTAHFYEFQDPDTQAICLAHELESGREYLVIVTTGGGLYRYGLGDRVRVTGFLAGAPCLRFVGREGEGSDLFGEKLHGTFVADVIRRALADQAIQTRFFLLAPVVDAHLGTGYALFLEAQVIPNADRLRRCLETGLTENFHYAHCRKLGQLNRARLFHIQPAACSSEAVFLRAMHARGVKPGDVKMLSLDRCPGWEQRFVGQFIE
jgi:hypothetical protein